MLSSAVETLAGAADEAERRLASAVNAWDPPVHALVIFGSFARRDGGPASDLDRLLVRPDGVGEEDGRWHQQRYTLAREAERWTGNHTQIVELSVAELESAKRDGDPLMGSLAMDGRVLVGPPLHVLLRPTAPLR